MGILDLILGKSNPIAQQVDQNPLIMSNFGAGLASGQNFAGGLANAVQSVPGARMAQNSLQSSLINQQAALQSIQYQKQQMEQQQAALALAASGRNQTADWLETQPVPQLKALAPLVRNGAVSGSDVLSLMTKPGQTVDPGASVLPNPYSPMYNAPLAGGPNPNLPSPTAPPGPLPPIPTAAPSAAPQAPIVADAGNYTPKAINGPQTAADFYQGFGMSPPPPIPAPNPVASLMTPQSGPQAAAPAPIAGPQAPANQIQPIFTAPATNPMQMTPAARQALGLQYGLSGAPLASFVVSGRMPANVSQTDSFVPATPEDRAKWGISPADPQVYRKNSITGELQAIPGSIGASTNNGDTPPPGATGSPAIDPTQPGYTSKPVVAGLTQAAIDQKALSYLTSGTIPPIGRTGSAGVQSAAIANRMAEMDPSGNLAANKSQLKSLTESLAVQQKYLDSTQRSIANAEAGFSQVINTFQGKINTSQYPSINAAENAAAAQLSPGDISAYKAGLQEVANEWTQVFSRGGQVTDAVRNRAQSIANGDLSLPDLQKVLTELRAQGDIVVKGSQDQVKQITGQINGIVEGATPGTSVATQATPDKPTYTYNPATGKLE